MQVYAPRDPLQEYLDGKITLRKLRVMIEHLPRDSAWGRDANGPWGDEHRLLYDVDAQLRILNANFVSAVNRRITEPTFLPKPDPARVEQAEAEVVDDYLADQRADLLRVLNRDN